MVVGNQPLGGEDESPEWTPALGLRRGLTRGALAAAGLALALGPMAIWLPALVFPSLTRAVIAFGVTWILLWVVCNAAGMIGRGCLWIALGLTIAVLLSQHVVWAICGLPGAALHVAEWYMFPGHFVAGIIGPRREVLNGAGWFHPLVLGIVNGIPLLVGSGFCVAKYGRD